MLATCWEGSVGAGAGPGAEGGGWGPWGAVLEPAPGLGAAAAAAAGVGDDGGAAAEDDDDDGEGLVPGGLQPPAAAAAGGCPPAPRITWAPPRGRWRAGHARLAQPLAAS